MNGSKDAGNRLQLFIGHLCQHYLICWLHAGEVKSLQCIVLQWRHWAMICRTPRTTTTTTGSNSTHANSHRLNIPHTQHTNRSILKVSWLETGSWNFSVSGSQMQNRLIFAHFSRKIYRLGWKRHHKAIYSEKKLSTAWANNIMSWSWHSGRQGDIIIQTNRRCWTRLVEAQHSSVYIK